MNILVFDTPDELAAAAAKRGAELLRKTVEEKGRARLMLSTGAGSASRHSIGTAVVGGMLAATGIAIFFIPSFFELIMKATHGIHGEHDPAAPADGSWEAKA